MSVIRRHRTTSKQSSKNSSVNASVPANVYEVAVKYNYSTDLRGCKAHLGDCGLYRYRVKDDNLSLEKILQGIDVYSIAFLEPISLMFLYDGKTKCVYRMNENFELQKFINAENGVFPSKNLKTDPQQKNLYVQTAKNEIVVFLEINRNGQKAVLMINDELNLRCINDFKAVGSDKIMVLGNNLELFLVSFTSFTSRRISEFYLASVEAEETSLEAGALAICPRFRYVVVSAHDSKTGSKRRLYLLRLSNNFDIELLTIKEYGKDEPQRNTYLSMSLDFYVNNEPLLICYEHSSSGQVFVYKIRQNRFEVFQVFDRFMSHYCFCADRYENKVWSIDHSGKIRCLEIIRKEGEIRTPVDCSQPESEVDSFEEGVDEERDSPSRRTSLLTGADDLGKYGMQNEPVVIFRTQDSFDGQERGVKGDPKPEFFDKFEGSVRGSLMENSARKMVRRIEDGDEHVSEYPDELISDQNRHNRSILVKFDQGTPEPLKRSHHQRSHSKRHHESHMDSPQTPEERIWDEQNANDDAELDDEETEIWETIESYSVYGGSSGKKQATPPAEIEEENEIHSQRPPSPQRPVSFRQPFAQMSDRDNQPRILPHRIETSRRPPITHRDDRRPQSREPLRKPSGHSDKQRLVKYQFLAPNPSQGGQLQPQSKASQIFEKLSTPQLSESNQTFAKRAVGSREPSFIQPKIFNDLDSMIVNTYQLESHADLQRQYSDLKPPSRDSRLIAAANKMKAAKDVSQVRDLDANPQPPITASNHQRRVNVGGLITQNQPGQDRPAAANNTSFPRHIISHRQSSTNRSRYQTRSPRSRSPPSPAPLEISQGTHHSRSQAEREIERKVRMEELRSPSNKLAQRLKQEREFLKEVLFENQSQVEPPQQAKQKVFNEPQEANQGQDLSMTSRPSSILGGPLIGATDHFSPFSYRKLRGTTSVGQENRSPVKKAERVKSSINTTFRRTAQRTLMGGLIRSGPQKDSQATISEVTQDPLEYQGGGDGGLGDLNSSSELFEVKKFSEEFQWAQTLKAKLRDHQIFHTELENVISFVPISRTSGYIGTTFKDHNLVRYSMTAGEMTIHPLIREGNFYDMIYFRTHRVLFSVNKDTGAIYRIDYFSKVEKIGKAYCPDEPGLIFRKWEQSSRIFILTRRHKISAFDLINSENMSRGGSVIIPSKAAITDYQVISRKRLLICTSDYCFYMYKINKDRPSEVLTNTDMQYFCNLDEGISRLVYSERAAIAVVFVKNFKNGLTTKGVIFQVREEGGFMQEIEFKLGGHHGPGGTGIELYNINFDVVWKNYPLLITFENGQKQKMRVHLLKMAGTEMIKFFEIFKFFEKDSFVSHFIEGSLVTIDLGGVMKKIDFFE